MKALWRKRWLARLAVNLTGVAATPPSPQRAKIPGFVLHVARQGLGLVVLAGLLGLNAGCGGGGGGGLKVPPGAAPITSGGGSGGLVTPSVPDVATVYLDATSLGAGRSAQAAAACDGLTSPFKLHSGALAHCQDTPTGITTPLTLTVTLSSSTQTQTLTGAAGVSLKNLPTGRTTLKVSGLGPERTLTVELVAGLTMHLRAVAQGQAMALMGAYSASVNPARFREFDQVGFNWPVGEDPVWHTDNGVAYVDKNADGVLGPGDESTYDQDFDGVDDATDTDDDNDATADSQDTDSDNDGSLDNQDTQDTDDDNDGEPDLTDTGDGDRDNDGIPDTSDTTVDPFLKSFALMAGAAPLSTATVGAVVDLLAVTEPSGAAVSYRVSGGMVSGNVWTLPVTPGVFSVTAILTSASVPGRRTLHLSVGVGGPAQVVHDPVAFTLLVGQTRTLDFRVLDAQGNLLTATPALVLSGGAVTLQNTTVQAVKPGQATVTATLGGLSASVLVNVPDTTGPGITLNDTVPASTISPSVVVAGFVSDPAVTQVSVTGGALPVTLNVGSGFFAGEVRLPLGAVTLTLSATDGAGNTSTATVSTTRLQDVLPTLALTPIPPLTIGTDVLLSGQLTDNNTTQVTVTAEGGYLNLLELSAGGAFSLVVPLSVGLNTLTVSAMDAVENAVSQSLTITRLENSLRSLTSPQSGQTILPGQSATVVLDAGNILGASASVWIGTLNVGVALRDDGQSPDLLLGDGLYTGVLTAPAVGPVGAVNGLATLTDQQGVSGSIEGQNLFVFDARPIVGNVSCDCAGVTKHNGDVVTFTLSASAYPATGTATLVLDADLGTVALTDTDGNGQYTGQFTVPAAGTGTFGGTFTFTDALGNVRTGTGTALLSMDNTPVCTSITHNATGTLVGGNVVHVRVDCGAGLGVSLQFTNGSQFLYQGLQVRDDGLNGDVTAGDNLFETDLTIPSCTEVPNGVISLTFTDLFGNGVNTQVGNPVVVLAEPGIGTFTTSISAGATVRGGTPVTFTITAPETGGTATVNALTLSQTYTLTEQGGGTYSSTVNMPLSGSFTDVDMQAFFANATCPNVQSDPIVLADYFDLDNTPILSNFAHAGTGGTVFTGGQGWTVSVQGPENAQSVTVQIIGLGDVYTLPQVAALGGGEASYSASLVVTGTGSVDAADVKVTFVDALGNTGYTTLTTSMTLDNTAPPMVTGFSAQASGTFARLTFTRPSSDTTGYLIQRSAENLSDFTNSFPLSSSAASLTYDDTAVSAGGTYTYRVVAVDRVGLMSPASATQTVAVGTPQAPTLSRPVPRGTADGGGLQLRWPTYLGGATVNTVKIYRGFSDAVGSADPGSTELLSQSLVVFQAATTFNDTLTSSEGVYYYRSEIWTDFGEHVTGQVISQSISALWQLYYDPGDVANAGLVRRLTGGDDGNVSGGDDNTLAGSLHYSVTSGLTGLSEKSRLKADANLGVLLVTRPGAGAVSVLDLAGNTVGEVTGLSNPTHIELDTARGWAYVVTGSGPYGVTRIDYTTPSAPMSTPFGTDVLGASLSTPNEPRAITVDSGSGRVFLEGVDSRPQANDYNASSALSITFTETGGLAGNGDITASADLGSLNDGAFPDVENNVDLTMLLTINIGGATIGASDPLILSISVNSKPVKTIKWSGATNDLNVVPPLKFALPRSIFKFQTGSPDTIEVQNISHHQYKGRIASGAVCPAPDSGATSWCYVRNTSNRIDLRIALLTNPVAAVRSIGVYDTNGTELGWITDSLSSSDMVATADGNFFVAEDWRDMGYSSSSNKSFSLMQSTAFSDFASNPVYDGTNNPIGNRQFYSLGSRNDLSFRRRGVADGGNPKIGWIAPNRVHASTNDSGATYDLWLSAPLYRYATNTSLPSRSGPSAETMPMSVARCSNAGGGVGCFTPGTPSWFYVGFTNPTAMAEDTPNNRLYVCDPGAAKVYVFHDTSQSIPATCLDGPDANGLGLDDDVYSACNTVTTPGSLFKEETAQVGGACELVVARP